MFATREHKVLNHPLQKEQKRAANPLKPGNPPVIPRLIHTFASLTHTLIYGISASALSPFHPLSRLRIVDTALFMISPATALSLPLSRTSRSQRVTGRGIGLTRLSSSFHPSYTPLAALIRDNSVIGMIAASFDCGLPETTVRPREDTARQ